MGIFKGAMVLAALAFAAPVWAHGGHGHDRGWDGGRGHHYGWDRDNHGGDWRHHGHHYRDRDRTRGAYYPNHYYYGPQRYGYVAPAPGVHIVAPNIYIAFR
jgi:hypothetical protein